jgi:hypothetical protein
LSLPQLHGRLTDILNFDLAWRHRLCVELGMARCGSCGWGGYQAPPHGVHHRHGRGLRSHARNQQPTNQQPIKVGYVSVSRTHTHTHVHANTHARTRSRAVMRTLRRTSAPSQRAGSPRPPPASTGRCRHRGSRSHAAARRRRSGPPATPATVMKLLAWTAYPTAAVVPTRVRTAAPLSHGLRRAAQSSSCGARSARR